MKILILKPSSLGDVIHALPVLRLLKQHHPQSEIYWWIDIGLTSLLRHDPDLAGLIPFERKRWSSPVYWNEMLQSIREMRALQFDLVIDLQGLARSGTFAWLANGKLLVGIEDGREGAHGYYDISVPRPSWDTHAVDWYLQTLRAVRVPVHRNFVWLPPNPYHQASIRSRWNAAQHPWIILNPGARWLNKRWPAPYFARLAALLAQDLPHHHFAVMGGPSDAEMGKLIAAAVPGRCVNLAGQTSLPEMIEWVRQADLMVTNDTGPMHVAAALDKPLVALFGPTSPQRTGPYGQIANVLQKPLACAPCMTSRCHQPYQLECLRTLTPEEVQAAVLKRLRK